MDSGFSYPKPGEDASSDYFHQRNTIKCPLMYKCEKSIEVTDVRAHCEEEHGQSIFYDEFFYPNMKFEAAHVVVFIKNYITYLIYCHIIEGDLRFAVFCLNPCNGLLNDRFNIKLFRSSDDELIFNDDYHVIIFDEDKHCPRCTFGSSRNRCHPGISREERIAQLPLIDNTAATELFKGKTFNCQIQLFSSEHVPEPDINNNAGFQELLSCHFCYCVMHSNIFSCTNGHVICEYCKNRKNKCYCKQPFETRNLLAEQLAKEYSLARCKNEGCLFVDKLTHFEAHEAHCRFRQSRE